MPHADEKPKVELQSLGGTGLCPEAQADGVPCCELGRDCETCENAVVPEAPKPKR